ncbi:complement C1q-like protein 3, partial [Biomphalaria glabrata]
MKCQLQDIVPIFAAVVLFNSGLSPVSSFILPSEAADELSTDTSDLETLTENIQPTQSDSIDAKPILTDSSWLREFEHLEQQDVASAKGNESKQTPSSKPVSTETGSAKKTEQRSAKPKADKSSRKTSSNDASAGRSGSPRKGERLSAKQTAPTGGYLSLEERIAAWLLAKRKEENPWAGQADEDLPSEPNPVDRSLLLHVNKVDTYSNARNSFPYEEDQPGLRGYNNPGSYIDDTLHAYHFNNDFMNNGVFPSFENPDIYKSYLDVGKTNRGKSFGKDRSDSVSLFEKLGGKRNNKDLDKSHFVYYYDPESHYNPNDKSPYPFFEKEYGMNDFFPFDSPNIKTQRLQHPKSAKKNQFKDRETNSFYTLENYVEDAYSNKNDMAYTEVKNVKATSPKVIATTTKQPSTKKGANQSKSSSNAKKNKPKAEKKDARSTSTSKRNAPKSDTKINVENLLLSSNKSLDEREKVKASVLFTGSPKLQNDIKELKSMATNSSNPLQISNNTTEKVQSKYDQSQDVPLNNGTLSKILQNSTIETIPILANINVATPNNGTANVTTSSEVITNVITSNEVITNVTASKVVITNLTSPNTVTEDLNSISPMKNEVSISQRNTEEASTLPIKNEEASISPIKTEEGSSAIATNDQPPNSPAAKDQAPGPILKHQNTNEVANNSKDSTEKNVLSNLTILFDNKIREGKQEADLLPHLSTQRESISILGRLNETVPPLANDTNLTTRNAIHLDVAQQTPNTPEKNRTHFSREHLNSSDETFPKKNITDAPNAFINNAKPNSNAAGLKTVLDSIDFKNSSELNNSSSENEHNTTVHVSFSHRNASSFKISDSIDEQIPRLNETSNLHIANASVSLDHGINMNLTNVTQTLNSMMTTVREREMTDGKSLLSTSSPGNKEELLSDKLNLPVNASSKSINVTQGPATVNAMNVNQTSKNQEMNFEKLHASNTNANEIQPDTDTSRSSNLTSKNETETPTGNGVSVLFQTSIGNSSHLASLLRLTGDDVKGEEVAPKGTDREEKSMKMDLVLTQSESYHKTEVEQLRNTHEVASRMENSNVTVDFVGQKDSSLVTSSTPRNQSSTQQMNALMNSHSNFEDNSTSALTTAATTNSSSPINSVAASNSEPRGVEASQAVTPVQMVNISKSDHNKTSADQNVVIELDNTTRTTLKRDIKDTDKDESFVKNTTTKAKNIGASLIYSNGTSQDETSGVLGSNISHPTESHDDKNETQTLSFGSNISRKLFSVNQEDQLNNSRTIVETLSSDIYLDDNMHNAKNMENSTRSLPQENSTRSLPRENSTRSLPQGNSTRSLPQENSTRSLPRENSARTRSLPEENSASMRSLPEENSSSISLPQENSTSLRSLPQENSTSIRNILQENSSQSTDVASHTTTTQQVNNVNSGQRAVFPTTMSTTNVSSTNITASTETSSSVMALPEALPNTQDLRSKQQEDYTHQGERIGDTLQVQSNVFNTSSRTTETNNNSNQTQPKELFKHTDVTNEKVNPTWSSLNSHNDNKTHSLGIDTTSLHVTNSSNAIASSDLLIHTTNKSSPGIKDSISASASHGDHSSQNVTGHENIRFNGSLFNPISNAGKKNNEFFKNVSEASTLTQDRRSDPNLTLDQRPSEQNDVRSLVTSGDTITLTSSNDTHSNPGVANLTLENSHFISQSGNSSHANISSEPDVPPISAYMIQDFSLRKATPDLKKDNSNGNNPQESTPKGNDKAQVNPKEANSSSNAFSNISNAAESPCVGPNCDLMPVSAVSRSQAAVSAVLTSHFGPAKDIMIPFDLELL